MTVLGEKTKYGFDRLPHNLIITGVGGGNLRMLSVGLVCDLVVF